jgi:tRNA threonylcarbamoyladenosine biosynthesis protein TsaB
VSNKKSEARRNRLGRKSFLKILAIESSNQTLSVATMEDGLVVAEYTRNGNLQHSTQLMPAVQDVLQAANWTPQDLDRIAISKGPGSYTGVRIGATIAKTLAWTLDKPLIPVSSLKVLAANIDHFDGLVVPIMDARRNNMYTAAYEITNGQIEEELAECHIASEDWFNQLKETNQPILFVGQDLSNYQDAIEANLGQQAHFSLKKQWLPSAGVLANLAITAEAEDVHIFTPEYLKKPEAEENWQKTHEGSRKGDYVERID